MKSQHEIGQRERWGAVFKLMTEQERAQQLADLELNLAWDRLDERERASALAAVEADRQWPGTFERMEEAARQANLKAEEAKRARDAEYARKLAEVTKELDKLSKQREATAQAVREHEEREQREAAAELERRAEEERQRVQKRVQKERERLMEAA